MTFGAWLLFFGYFGVVPFISLAMAGLVLGKRFHPAPFEKGIVNVLRGVFPLEPIMVRCLFVITILLTAFTCIRGVLAPIHGWDALTYHLPKSVWWMQHGVMLLPEFPGGWEFHKYEFGGVELLHALMMMPFGTPLLVNLPDVIAYVLCGVVSLLIVDRLEANRKARFLALILVLSSPTLKLLVGSCYVELHAVLLVLCAFLPLGEFLISGNLRYLYLVSAVVGCLVASKIIFLPLAVAYCVFLLFCIVRQRFTIASLVVATIIMGLPVLPWMVHNAICAGSLFAPFPVRLFGVLIFEGHAGLQHLIDLRSTIDASFSAEIVAFGNVAFELGLAPLGALFFFLRSASSVWWRISGILLVFTWSAFYRSEMSVVRLVWMQSRLVVAGVIPAVLIGACSKRVTEGALVWILVALALVQNVIATVKGVAPFEYFVVAGGFCIIFAGVCLSWFSRSKLLRWRSCVALLALVFYTLWVQRSCYSGYLHESFIYHEDQRYWADAALRVHTGGPYKIAVATGLESRGDNQKFFPFFGDRLQNSIVYISPSVSGEGIYPLKDNQKILLDGKKWEERLKQARVTHVMSFYPLAFELPLLEHDSMLFKRLEGGEGWGFYALNYEQELGVK
jgi:hypothetical protein